MIDTSASTLRPSSNPVMSPKIHIFPFPLQNHLISTRSRSHLDNFLLIRSCVLKLRVRPKTVKNYTFLLLFLG